MAISTRVEDLAQYGNALGDFPKVLLLKQARIFLGRLRRRDGTLGLLRMMVPIMCWDEPGIMFWPRIAKFRDGIARGMRTFVVLSTIKGRISWVGAITVRFTG